MKKSLFLSSGAAVFLSVAALASTGVYAEGANSEVNLTINPVLSINATESLDLEVVPTAAGKFTSGEIVANVITNDAAGYSLYLSSSTEETSLKHSSANASIATVASAVTSANMAKNTWGWSLGDTFNPVPASSSAQRIKKTTAPATGGEGTTVTIGAKVDTSIPSGAYSNTLQFTAVANSTLPAPTNWAGLLEIEYMQDMTPAKCAALPTPSATATETSQALFDTSNTELVPELVLTDKRDNKQYVTRKLADGKCWMTENLRLIDKTISSADSNLPSGETYTVPASDLSSFKGTYNTDSAYLDSTYGGYYNFYTVTAGWGGIGAKSGNSPKDICPKGWRLPTASGEFQTLYDNYNSSALMQGVPNLTLSGHVDYDGSVIIGQGEAGGFWFSTAYNSDTATFFGLNTSDVFAHYSNKYYGNPVRCVAR